LFVIWRWWSEGGYVVIRHSDWGWWPHFLWSPDLQTFEQFVPVVPNHKKRIPPLWFRGYIKTSKHGENT